MAAAGFMAQSFLSGETPAANRVSPMAASSSDSTSTDSSSESSSSTITANDFLTLLVTEMKNQDPTASTDPNQYINQLVNVNSLQQLISINETLTGALGTPDSSANAQTARANTAEPVAEAATNVTAGKDSAQTNTTNATTITAGDRSLQTLPGRLNQGNLSVPNVSPAADRLANALGGHASLGTGAK